MRYQKPARSRLTTVVVIGSVAIFGCDRSTTVSEIPEESRKALIQRKVDVKPGQAKSSRAGGPSPKGSASGR